MGVPTQGEVFAQLIEHLRKVQEACATLGHLHGLQANSKDTAIGQGWLKVAQLMRQIELKVIDLGQGKLQ